MKEESKVLVRKKKERKRKRGTTLQMFEILNNEMRQVHIWNAGAGAFGGGNEEDGQTNGGKRDASAVPAVFKT